MDLFLKNAGWIDIEVCLDKYQEYSFVMDTLRLLTLVTGEDGVTPPPRARQNQWRALSED